LAKSSNNNLINNIKKVVGENKKAWDSKIRYALLEYRITTNKSIGKMLFELVYGLEDKLLVNIQIPILCFAQQYTTKEEAI
jgi:hypothetical protein